MAKKKKYSEMTIDELNVELIEVKSSLFNFRFQKSMQQLEHPQKISHTKKEIARIKTYIRKLELGIN
tara:strand:+ start:1764 stop:1964 length:201 start_codon:yes stop_codon:yes gene_type:complete